MISAIHTHDKSFDEENSTIKTLHAVLAAEGYTGDIERLKRALNFAGPCCDSAVEVRRMKDQAAIRQRRFKAKRQGNVTHNVTGNVTGMDASHRAENRHSSELPTPLKTGRVKKTHPEESLALDGIKTATKVCTGLNGRWSEDNCHRHKGKRKDGTWWAACSGCMAEFGSGPRIMKSPATPAAAHAPVEYYGKCSRGCGNQRDNSGSICNRCEVEDKARLNDAGTDDAQRMVGIIGGIRDSFTAVAREA